jgi:outer membrane protein OmpA-like peptidoglycan-associated protein
MARPRPPTGSAAAAALATLAWAAGAPAALGQSSLTVTPLPGPAATTTAATGAAVPASRAAVEPLPASRPVIGPLPASRAEIGPAVATALGAAERLRSELDARETERGTVVTLPGDVLFDFDAATIRRDAVPSLEKLAELIRLTPGAPVTVEGHTDAKGREAYNLELSRRRARAVAEWLGRRPGVGRSRLREEGRGESAPVAPNERADGSDDPAGRQRNRRVEVVLGRP